jgi:SAM-dependent methyltransferase
MIAWNDIYRKYEQNGVPLGESLHPLFIRFIEDTKLRIRKALDLDCGDGRYLQFLSNRGFEVHGIDPNPDAVERTNRLLSASTAEVADMYDYEIPTSQYFLIFSVNNTHIGTKDQVSNLVKRVKDSLLQGGRFFICLPDINSARNWNIFKYEQGLDDGILREKDRYYSRPEIENLMSGYRNVQLILEDGTWFVRGTK